MVQKEIFPTEDKKIEFKVMRGERGKVLGLINNNKMVCDLLTG